MAGAREKQKETQRKRHGTESRSTEETTKERTMDSSSDARNRRQRDIERQRSIGSIRPSDQTKDEKGMAQSSSDHGEKVCAFYQAGRCRYGSNCRNVHLHEPRDRIGTKICTYFQKGACKFGSVCKFQHKQCQTRKPESESYRSEKRTKTIPGSDGETRLGFDLEERDIQENRRVDAQENLQDTEDQDNLQEIPENHDQQNPEEQIQRDIERQGREAQDNLQEQRLMEMPENQNVAAHGQQNLEEQRQRDIERQRSEARSRVDQIQPTVRFNDLSGMRESLRELGIKRKEGDGF